MAKLEPTLAMQLFQESDAEMCCQPRNGVMGNNEELTRAMRKAGRDAEDAFRDYLKCKADRQSDE